MSDAMDKTQAPTPRRRLEARKRGQVARSADLVSAAVLLSAILLMQATGPKLLAALRLMTQQTLANPTASVHQTDLFALTAQLAWAGFPLIAGVIAIAMVANLAQFGFLIREEKDHDTLDIGKGFARLFSPRSRAKLAIDLIKLTAVAWLTYSLIRQSLGQLVMIQQLDAVPAFAAGMSIVFAIAIRICVILLTLGVLDYAYQRWQHERDLRMTRREVEDELRQMQGTARRDRRGVNALTSPAWQGDKI